MSASNPPDKLPPISDTSICCRACRQPIHPQATTCHLCQSSQLPPSSWQRISSTLKWIGGIVTTLSLLLAMISLSKFYQDWSERRDTVNEIAASAQWLLRLGHYDQAWALYQQATELNPNAPQVRNGQLGLALRYVRDFRTASDQADQVLRQLTQRLYRGLPQAKPAEVATLLAHVGWTQVLRQNLQLPVLVPVEPLFLEALQADPDNPYANSMYGGWLLRQRPITVALIEQANEHFNRALAQPAGRRFSRQLQLRSLSSHSYASGDEIERAALSALLNACVAMLNKGEPLPEQRVRYRILDGYGRMGRAEHVEALLNVVEAEQHLTVYRWLLQADNDSRPAMNYQSRYIQARLLEKQGQSEQALTIYQQLLQVDDIRKPLQNLIDGGIERLTGALPARATARNFANDPVDSANPWAFHQQTLLNYNTDYTPTNVMQAVGFYAAVDLMQPDQRNRLLADLEPVLLRLSTAIAEREQQIAQNLPVRGYLDHLRRTWLELLQIHSRALSANQRREAAIAQLQDGLKRIELLDSQWDADRAELEFALAQNLAGLAPAKRQPGDLTQAMDYLAKAVEHGAISNQVTDWAQIKSPAFKALQALPRYQQLIRGR